MIKLKKIWHAFKITLIFLAMLFWLSLFLFSCSPQKRLNRLVKNNPELIKADTTFTQKQIEVPGVKIDTTFKASVNTEALSQILESYKTQIDSLTRRKLNTQISNYITQRACLDGPVTIHLKNGAWAKVEQKNGLFYFTYNDPPKIYNIKVPLVVMRVEAKISYNWRMFGFGTLAGCLIFTLIVLLLKRVKNG